MKRRELITQEMWDSAFADLAHIALPTLPRTLKGKFLHMWRVTWEYIIRSNDFRWKAPRARRNRS